MLIKDDTREYVVVVRHICTVCKYTDDCNPVRHHVDVAFVGDLENTLDLVYANKSDQIMAYKSLRYAIETYKP